jgi:hypothetical protein
MNKAESEVRNRLSIMFGVLTIMERFPLGYEIDVQTLRYEVARLRGEPLTRQYFVYAMGVLAQQGTIVACDRLGYWKAGSI